MPPGVAQTLQNKYGSFSGGPNLETKAVPASPCRPKIKYCRDAAFSVCVYPCKILALEPISTGLPQPPLASDLHLLTLSQKLP